MPEGTVKVDRSTKWGNPYRVAGTPHLSRADAARLFREDILNPDQPHPILTIQEIREELGGKNLACWCPLPAEGQPDHCHAAFLLEIANAGDWTYRPKCRECLWIGARLLKPFTVYQCPMCFSMDVSCHEFPPPGEEEGGEG
ncbi:MAG: hypothetical protein JWM59_2458 [Verrucomicrobiales bacterium]|nr:hypothetical protein [Verrucomicrobiales bacterium]